MHFSNIKIWKYKKKQTRQTLLDSIRKETKEKIKDLVLTKINEIIHKRKQQILIDKIRNIYSLGNTITENTHIKIKINFNKELGTLEILASNKYIHAVKYHFYHEIIYLYQDNDKTNIDTEIIKTKEILIKLDHIYRNSKYNKYKKTYNKFN